MNIASARAWIVLSSLILLAAILVFFVLAPVCSYPLQYDQLPRLLEITIPVFLGYLGSAVHFVFKNNPKPKSNSGSPDARLLGLLVRGPLLVFGIAISATLVAFGVSNRKSGAPGTGIGLDVLAALLTVEIGLLSATTSVAVAYLFHAKDHP